MSNGKYGDLIKKARQPENQASVKLDKQSARSNRG
jgi:hypothetical protein